MDLNDRKILVAGAGVSGIGAVSLLARKGIAAAVYDGNEKLDQEAFAKKCGLKDRPLFELGEWRDQLADHYDLLVLSPGISINSPVAQSFLQRAKPVWGEIALAAHYAKGRICAITGTNGKTTTTALTGEILKAYYPSTFVAGNIGIPFTEIADRTDEDSALALEISSFQLETARDFCPFVSAVLNVTPDHLDRHGTMEVYADTKLAVSANQTKDQVILLNYDDPITRKMAARTPARPVMFSRKEDLKEGILLKDDCFVIREKGREFPVCTVDEVLLKGSHNHENILAAIGLGYYMGVPVPRIRNVILSFKAVEHRIEYVRTVSGVDYYNDSKGTNPDAAIKGILSMDRPTVLIGGGYDKKASYDEWVKAFPGRVRTLVLVGQTADAIEETARKHGFHDIIRAGDFEDAVERARKAAFPGDAVLLSPACASWGMFKNYEERGRIFKEIVNRFKD